MLTKRQAEILYFIKKYSLKNGLSPSLEEIARQFKLRSVATIHEHLEKLQEKGYLKKEGGRPRSLAIQSDRMIQVPLLGMIAAGQPIEAIEDREIIAVPRNRLPRSMENIYALKVVGDSMIEENIYDGDIILVKHQAVAANGEKVVALINNNQATLKTFFYENGYVRLQPANKKMEAIIIRSGNIGFAIQGVVIDVIKHSKVDEYDL